MAGADGMDGAMGPAGADGADGSDAEVGDLQAQIDALTERITALEDEELPPEFAAGVATRTAWLTGDGADYDNDDLSVTLLRTVNDIRVYRGRAMQGYGGLDILDTGGSGAHALGGWLDYNHFGVIDAVEHGAQVYSVGMRSPATLALSPDAGHLRARWSGAMAGRAYWDTDDTFDDTGNDGLQRVPATGADAGNDADFVTGTANLAVSFAPTGTGLVPLGTLSITDVVAASTGADFGDFMVGTTSVADSDSSMVWTGMPIAAGAFGRHSITLAVANDRTADSLGVSVADPLTATAAPDPANAMNYLRGQYYGADGSEVGGVFREQVGWLDNLRGVVANNPGAVTVTPAMNGYAPVTLIGAFGAARQDIVP
jgi:hypothetical protein